MSEVIPHYTFSLNMIINVNYENFTGTNRLANPLRLGQHEVQLKGWVPGKDKFFGFFSILTTYQRRQQPHKTNPIELFLIIAC